MTKTGQRQRGFLLPIIVVLMLSSVLLWTSLQRSPSNDQMKALEKQAKLIYFWQQAALNYTAETGLKPASVANLLLDYGLSPSLATDDPRATSPSFGFGTFKLNFDFVELEHLDQHLNALAPYASREYDRLVIETLHVDQWHFSQHLQPRAQQQPSIASRFFADLDMTENRILNAKRVVADIVNADLNVGRLTSVKSTSQSILTSELNSQRAMLGTIDLVAYFSELADFNQALKACLSAAGICRN